jgi:hypothetical protein
MYTEVTFGLFLERLFAQVKSAHGIEFGQYPNTAIKWSDGDWLYEMDGFSVRLFRWPPRPKREILVEGWVGTQEMREQFEARFEHDFFRAIATLKAPQN